jgi:hypothetical protein
MGPAAPYPCPQPCGAELFAPLGPPSFSQELKLELQLPIGLGLFTVAFKVAVSKSENPDSSNCGVFWNCRLKRGRVGQFLARFYATPRDLSCAGMHVDLERSRFPAWPIQT